MIYHCFNQFGWPNTRSPHIACRASVRALRSCMAERSAEARNVACRGRRWKKKAVHQSRLFDHLTWRSNQEMVDFDEWATELFDLSKLPGLVQLTQFCPLFLPRRCQHFSHIGFGKVLPMETPTTWWSSRSSWTSWNSAVSSSSPAASSTGRVSSTRAMAFFLATKSG